jgi:hypothetical protein
VRAGSARPERPDRRRLKLLGDAPRMGDHADVAQLVEHHLAKVGVAGSNPVVRSRSDAVSPFHERSAGDCLGDSP